MTGTEFNWWRRVLKKNNNKRVLKKIIKKTKNLMRFRAKKFKFYIR
jgi:hypothetical protein